MKYLILCCLFLVFFSCEENTYIYEVEDIVVTPNNAEKDKEKTTEQFINILYANLHQNALSPSSLVDLSDLTKSIGDKKIAFEAITAKMMNDAEVLELMPTDEEMREDVESFVVNTYKRFFVRKPTIAEQTYFVNYINSNPNVTPEHIYFAFATSNEYYHY